MIPEQMFKAFKDLVDDSKTPILVNFQKTKDENDINSPSFVEVIQTDFSGRLRKFELDYHSSEKIINHFDLPKTETAVIFENGKTSKRLHGFKNVRTYLRTMSLTN